MSRKTFTVELYKGANVDKTYKRLSYAHVENDKIVVAGNHTELAPAYTMKKSVIVVPGRPIEFDISSVDFYSVYNCNYLAAYDDSKTNVWFGFIDNIEYLNDGTARISWSVDFWATYKNKIELTQNQFVERALYMPKEFLIDSKRTTDSSLPTDEKAKLISSTEIKLSKSDDDKPWYLIYLMPRFFGKGAGSVILDPNKSAGGPEDDTVNYDITHAFDLTHGAMNSYRYLDQKKAEESGEGDLDTSVTWKKWDSRGKLFDFTVADTGSAQTQGYAGEIYATQDLSNLVSIDLIGGEGLRISGCEVRRTLDLTNFEQVGTSSIYKFTADVNDLDNSVYENDNLSDIDNPYSDTKTFANLYNANSDREEISVGDKKIKLNPALRLSGTIGLHVWDSVLPGFKPFYSFYKVNGLVSPIKPWMADETSPVVLADSDRSVPIYADQSIAYFLSHKNRLNSDLQKQLIAANASVSSAKIAFDNSLKKIAQDYDVSAIALKNALYNSTRVANESNKIDLDQLAYALKQNSDNLKTNNDLSYKNLGATQGASAENTARSQDIAVQNMTDSNATSLSVLESSQSTSEANLKRSNQAATDNLELSQGAATTILKASQATALSNQAVNQKLATDNMTASNQTAQDNLSTGNDTSKANQKASTKTQGDNLDVGTNLSKSNTDKQLANQNKNLSIQKAESFVTGLNLTSGLAKFLTGALYSAATGFLDYDIGTQINGNNANLSKELADDANKASKTQMGNSLGLALDNLERSYESSLAQMKASQATGLSNLAASQKAQNATLAASNATALSNLKENQTVAANSLLNSQTAATDNLSASNGTAYSNMQSSQATTLANLKRSNKMVQDNLSSTFAAQNKNFERSYQIAVNSLKNGNSISNQSLANALKKALMSLNYGNDLSEVNLDNSTLKAYTLAFMDAQVAQDQSVVAMAANIDSMVNGFEAELQDWMDKGNSTKATDGQAAVTQIFKKLTPFENIFTVQDYTKRQMVDYVHTNGSLVNRKIGLDQLLDQKDNQDYFGNQVSGLQYIKTSNIRLQGELPSEALNSIQSAFDSGVYVYLNASGNDLYKSKNDTAVQNPDNHEINSEWELENE